MKTIKDIELKTNFLDHRNLNILYLNIGHQDYLSDSLLLGLKSIDTINITEYPKNKFIYKSQVNDNGLMYGRAFTLYNMLNDIHANYLEQLPLNFDKFDFVIFSSITNQIKLYLKLNKIINSDKLIIIDGDDFPAVVPFFGKFWKNMMYWNFPILHRKHKYFKRELTFDTIYYRYYKLIPKVWVKKLKLSKNIIQISFSIPLEKITINEVRKVKEFPSHIVDQELAEKIVNSNTKYVFNNEVDYYYDLQSSKYGITTKRAGWDCLRHYEIAANAAVICFRDLDQKPNECAPHGLVPGINCLSYSSYEDLMAQIRKISDHDYKKLQIESLKWAKSKNTKSLAYYFLNQITNLSE